MRNLKTLFTVLFFSILGLGNVWADTSGSESLTWSEQRIDNATSIAGEVYSLGDYFTVTCTKNNAGTNPTYYTTGTAVRCYVTKNTSNGNIITVSTSTNNVYITKVTYAGTHSKSGTTSFTYSGSPSSSDANSASYSLSDHIQTASATLCETGNSKNGQFYFTSITVEYTKVGGSEESTV